MSFQILIRMKLSKVREIFPHMILYHEYPFMQVEHVLFNKFMKACTLQ
jgi:hypothetical protein